MNSGHSVFRQLLQLLPRHEFDLCVRRYRGNYRAKSFSTFDQFLCLAYAQMTGRESLRDIETCLNSHRERNCITSVFEVLYPVPHWPMQMNAETGEYFRILVKF